MAYQAPRASSITIVGLSELKKQLNQIAERGISDALNRYLIKMGMRIAASASSKLQRGGKGRFTGRLASSLDHEPANKEGGVETLRSKSAITLQVGTNVEYGKYAEGWPRAPRRHFLPYAGHPDFVTWSKRIRRTPLSEIRRGGLMVGGPKSIRPFLLPALIENISYMNSQLETALEAK